MRPDARALLALLLLGQYLVVLDVAIVNVALPSIQRDLGLSATGLQWVVNGYTIAFAGFLLLGGGWPTSSASDARSSPAWGCSWRAASSAAWPARRACCSPAAWSRASEPPSSLPRR